jgi:acyl-CoA thioester hydrolase
MIDLSLFRFSHPTEIRFADLDMLGHVNNAKYFTYMETARLLYFREVIGWSGERGDLPVILARADCDFKLPLALGDSVSVYTRIMRIGHKSFDFEYVILRETDQAEAARGTSVQVAYDYHSGQSVPVPDEWRARMIAYEPGQIIGAKKDEMR